MLPHGAAGVAWICRLAICSFYTSRQDRVLRPGKRRRPMVRATTMPPMANTAMLWASSTAAPTILDYAPFQDAYDCFEDGLEGEASYITKCVLGSTKVLRFPRSQDQVFGGL